MHNGSALCKCGIIISYHRNSYIMWALNKDMKKSENYKPKPDCGQAG
jgi:hypothetical protein